MKIDIHRHAKDPGKADRVLRNLFHNEGSEIIVGASYSSGLHPWHIKEQSLEADLQAVREMANDSSVLAVGETGLDKACDVPQELQEKAFAEQVKLASMLGKPMVIHCVRAYQEVFRMKKLNPGVKPWIIHWFNASEEMALQLIRHGFYLSFGLTLFKENSKACQAFVKIPMEHIFLETDDAGCSIEEVYEQAASLRGISIQEMETAVEENFIRCFNCKP